MESSAASPPTAHHRSLDSKYKCQFGLRLAKLENPLSFGMGARALRHRVMAPSKLVWNIFFSFFLNAAHPKEPIIGALPNKQIAAFANPQRCSPLRGRAPLGMLKVL